MKSSGDSGRTTTTSGIRRLRHPSATRLAARPVRVRRPQYPPGPDVWRLFPVYRTIVAVDIEGSTTRTDVAKARLRAVMYEMLEAALGESGITERHRDPLIDRGDGAFILIRPVDQAPKTLLLTTFIPVLRDLLADHNQAGPDEIRLRAAVHAGEVNYDRRGCFGEAIDLTFRLLDAPEAKTTLRHAPEPLVLVVSETLYQSVVRHGYEGLDEHTFAPLVHVQLAGQQHFGWVRY